MPYVSSSFLPYFFSVFPCFLPFLVKKTVRAVGGTFIGIEKNRGGYTQHAKTKRHSNGKHKTTINHSVGSKRFRPVSEKSTRSESQIRRKKSVHFFLSSRGQDSSVFLCSETKRKRPATRAISIKECKGRDI